jgi:hypothetical protein
LNFINGADVSNPTQNFTDEEWRKLAYNGGRLYVAQAHEQMNGRGHGGHDGRVSQGYGHSSGCWNDNGGGRNVGAIGTDHNDGGQGTEMAGEDNAAGRDRGAQHGHGFGRGVYHH